MLCSLLSFALCILTASARCALLEVSQRAPGAADSGPGTAEHPFKTLAPAAAKAGPGDTVVLHDGIYREQIVIKSSGTAGAPIRFESAPGAHVVLTGADRLTGWQKLEGSRPVYRVPWPHKFIGWSPHMTHPDDDYHRLIGRCEQVAVDGYLLRQVLDAAQLAPGTFYADTSNQVLHVWDPANRDLNRTLVEASVRQEIFRIEGDYVQVRGLRFRYAANMAQHGAVVLAGRHDALEDSVIEDMNSSGATFAGEDQMVRRCVFRDNGQLGFGANGAHRLLFTGCVVENNNTKGFDRGWEAGGDKLVLCRDAVLDQSRFIRNRGNGIWLDIGNEHCTVRQCLIAENEDSGIFCEISYALQVRDNVITGNGFASTAGAWGAQAGISLSSSPDCVLERNLLVGNREGFDFREQTRTTPRIGQKGEVPVWNHDELIRHNILALNRDAQLWGWFDMKDNRHWPARDFKAEHGTNAAAPTLETLRLRFVDNVYYAGPGEGWFNWGVTWARHQSYASLAEFQSALGIDTGGRVLDPAFANVAALDFRVRREAMFRLGANYPQGAVPGVQLGIRE